MKKWPWYALLALQPVVIVGGWAWVHTHHPLGNLLIGDAAGQYLAWGRLAGLLAAFGVLLQLFLMSRFRPFEQAFGFDRLIRLHRCNGALLIVLLVAHPILITAGHARQTDVSLWDQAVDFCRNWDFVFAAVIGLALMIAAIAISLPIARRRLRYEAWHGTHLVLYVAIALAFGHQLAVGSDFTDHRWFAVYWRVLYAGSFASLIAYRVLRPFWLLGRHRFVVAGLEAETGDVTSVHIEGMDMGAFSAEAGQFVIVRFLAPGFRWQAHPFSISARPDGQRLRLTIKRLGDFTRRIPGLQVGTRVLIDGPHGVFVGRRCRSSKVLLIAAGMGITPIRPLAEELVATGREVILLYGNRRHADVVFEQELARLCATSAGRLRVFHVLSGEPNWPGERGRISRAWVQRLVPDVRDRDVYVCGPSAMMAQVRVDLIAMGVPADRLHAERFAL